MSARAKYQSIMLSEETDDNEMGKEVVEEEEEEEEEKGDDGTPGTETVNYGYHPIIDFFDKYRFAANR